MSLRKALATVGSSQGTYYYRSHSGRNDKGKLRDPLMLSAIKEFVPRKPIPAFAGRSKPFTIRAILVGEGPAGSPRLEFSR